MFSAWQNSTQGGKKRQERFFVRQGLPQSLRLWGNFGKSGAVYLENFLFFFKGKPLGTRHAGSREAFGDWRVCEKSEKNRQESATIRQILDFFGGARL
ncbi:hypothetical protein B5F76_07270 [Desulfovibrio sp. An276]|nr:hypothetical protein B5F76_07270 [Desulfovibrio sp. An276]